MRTYLVLVVFFAALGLYLADDAQTFATKQKDDRCAAFAAANLDC